MSISHLVFFNPCLILRDLQIHWGKIIHHWNLGTLGTGAWYHHLLALWPQRCFMFVHELKDHRWLEQTRQKKSQGLVDHEVKVSGGIPDFWVFLGGLFGDDRFPGFWSLDPWSTCWLAFAICWLPFPPPCSTCSTWCRHSLHLFNPIFAWVICYPMLISVYKKKIYIYICKDCKGVFSHFPSNTWSLYISPMLDF